MFHTTASAWSTSPHWQKIVSEQLNGRVWKQWLLSNAQRFAKEHGKGNLPIVAAATATFFGLFRLIPDQTRLLITSCTLIGAGCAGLIWNAFGAAILRLSAQGFRAAQAKSFSQTVQTACYAVARKYAGAFRQV